MKCGITNSKGALGSGTSIPTITILASQQNTSVLPDVMYELTQEQYDLFLNNNICNVELPNGTKANYTKYSDNDTEQYNILVYQNFTDLVDQDGDYIKRTQFLIDSSGLTMMVFEREIRAGSGGTNAYTEIKNSQGTIDILTTDWIANVSDANYPYKWEFTNGYLVGAVNCIAVYDKDSDTTLLAPTIDIDEVNGKLIIYASEMPSETISIQKIAVFNDLNAYINYSNEIVQQVLANTSTISDINNTKLPQYTKKEEEKSAIGITGTMTSIIDRKANTGGVWLKTYRTNTPTQYSEISMPYGAVRQAVSGSDKSSYSRLDGDGLELSVSKESGGTTTTHVLTFDSDGALKIDGNAVGAGGGGSGNTLYQHNIYMSNTSDRKLNCQITIINDSNVAFDYSTLMAWLDDNDFNYNGSTHNWYNATGHWTNGFISGVDFVEAQNQIFCIALSSDGATQTTGAILTTRLEIKDTIVEIGETSSDGSSVSIPTITIDQSQISLNADNNPVIQFTQEQFSIINTNNVVGLDNSGDLKIYEKSIEGDIALLNYWWNSADNELALTKIFVNDETFEGEVFYNANVLSGGGGESQKYQHNIYISCKDGGNNITLQAMMQLTNDSNTAIETENAIITEMKKSISTYGNYAYGIMASGGYTYSSNYYIISHAYLGAGGTTLKFTGYNCASKNNDYNGSLSGTVTYRDTIVAL